MKVIPRLRTRVEPCLRGDLRLRLDGAGRVCRAELVAGRRRHGPVLEVDYEAGTGTLQRKGDSHLEAYQGGCTALYTAWSDGPLAEGKMPLSRWVEECLARLRHIGVELLWREADVALAARRWQEAARAYATVRRQWKGYHGGWAFDAVKRRRQGRTVLGLLGAIARAGLTPGDVRRARAVERALVSRLQEESDGAAGLVERARLILTSEQIERALGCAFRRELQQFLDGHDAEELQEALGRRLRQLDEQLPGSAPLFVAQLVTLADRSPALARLAAYFGARYGRPARERRRLLERVEGQERASVADLNNRALALIVEKRFTQAAELLSRVEATLSRRGSPSPAALRRGGAVSRQALEHLNDEYYFSHHQAALLWELRRHREALPYAERSFAAEQALREATAFEDPFSGATRYSPEYAHSGGAWALLSVLTGLGQHERAMDLFRSLLEDKAVMRGRLKGDSSSAEFMLLGGLSISLDRPTPALLERARATYRLARRWVPRPNVPNLTYTYACFEARLGRRAAALDWLARALDQGVARGHARVDPDFESLRGDARFRKLVGPGTDESGSRAREGPNGSATGLVR